jgi:hypothetical protein
MLISTSKTRAPFSIRLAGVEILGSDIRHSLDNCVAMTLGSVDRVAGRTPFGALADRTAELFAGLGLGRLALHRSD